MAEFCEPSKSLAKNIIEINHLKPRDSKGNDEMEKIYPLQIQPYHKDEEKQIRLCALGEIQNSQKVFNILVIGPTGSGKSTMVNALINYLTGVEYDDNFRLEIVSLEESEKPNEKTKSASQTKWITVYKIGNYPDSKEDFQINIVDTPGLCDTGGKKQDEKIFEQVRHLYESYVSHINVVCITFNGTTTRLTAEQKYIFDSIQKLFGKDIINHIVVWATNSVTNKPKILDALRDYEVPFVAHFCFENGNLFLKIPEDTKERRRSKEDFEDTYDSFHDFFTKFGKIESQGLESSLMVLDERKRLVESNSVIENKIRLLVDRIQNKEHFKSQIAKLSKDVSDLQNITFEVISVYNNKDGFQQRVYNCESCKETCCDPCDHSNFFTWIIYNCANLSIDSQCKNCRCMDTQHRHSRYNRYSKGKKTLAVIEKEQKKKPDSIIIAKDQMEEIKNIKKTISEKDTTSAKNLLQEVAQEIAKLHKELFKNLISLHNAIKTLKKHALFQKEDWKVSEILRAIEEADDLRMQPVREDVYEKIKEFLRDKGIP